MSINMILILACCCMFLISTITTIICFLKIKETEDREAKRMEYYQSVSETMHEITECYKLHKDYYNRMIDAHSNIAKNYKTLSGDIMKLFKLWDKVADDYIAAKNQMKETASQINSLSEQIRDLAEKVTNMGLYAVDDFLNLSQTHGELYFKLEDETGEQQIEEDHTDEEVNDS